MAPVTEDETTARAGHADPARPAHEPRCRRQDALDYAGELAESAEACAEQSDVLASVGKLMAAMIFEQRAQTRALMSIAVTLHGLASTLDD